MNLKPLHDRVVIQPDDSEDKSPGGIYLPDKAQKKPQRGQIIAVGPGRTEDGKVVAMQVKRGDKVLYGKYSGTEVTVEHIDYLICHESDIMAVL